MRLKRVIDPAGVSIICALDHGMTSPTFLEPLADIGARTAEVVAGGANVIMMSKGMIRLAEPAFSPTTSLALLLSASANPADPPARDRPDRPGGGGRPPRGRRRGAVHGPGRRHRGRDDPTLAGIGRECAAMGMPLIAEAEFPTTYAAVEQLKEQYGFEYLRRNVRLCAELGADIVKTNWPGDGESFARLVEAAAGIPLVLAGGSRLGDRELLQRMEAATAAGGIGCSVGRNIFMHRSPEAITRALSRVIRERWSADKAFEELQADRRAGGAGREGGVHDRPQPGRGPGGRRAGARPARGHPPGRGLRDLRHRRPDLLQRRPAGAGPWVLGHEPVGILERVGPDAALPPGWRPAGGCSSARSSPAASAASAPTAARTSASTTCCTATTPSPGPTPSWPPCPRSPSSNLIPLPPDLPSELATVVDPFACALNGIEVLDVGLGDTVLILGAGPIGCWQAVMARDRGAGRVFLCDVNRQRLDLALEAVGGFVDDAWVAGEDNGLAGLLERTGGAGPSGSAWPRPPSRPSRRPWRWRPSGPGWSTSPACPSTTR